MKRYKPSMFNHIVKNEDTILLYNSYVGTKSICEVSNSKKEKIISLMSESQMNNIDDEDFNKLVSKGFLVEENLNEYNLRNKLYSEYICDNILTLVIHTTQDCNFRCQYCYLDFQPIPMSEDIQENVIKFVQKNLYKYSGVKISWFGGEPLLEMGVIEKISESVMRLCKKAKKTYTASITTNGYLLSPINIEKLIKYNVSTYTITLDGLKENHDSHRFLKGHQPTFEKIISNLLYIKDKVKCSKLRVVIRTNITKTFIPIMKQYYEFYNEKFGDDYRFSLFIRPVRDAGGERVKEIKNTLLSNEDVNNVLEYMNEISDKIDFMSNYTELEPAGFTCPAICRGKYSIDVKGNVSKCDAVEEGIGIGHLEKGDLIRYGTNEEDWMMGCFEIRDKCENCYFSAVCFKGTCPITYVKNKEFKCRIDGESIDVLIRLFAKSRTIECL